MSRLNFLEKYAVEGRHYDFDKELDKAVDNHKSSAYGISYSNLDMHPRLKEKHINKLIDSGQSFALRNKNATVNNVTHALNGENSFNRREALRHPLLTQEHIDKILDFDSDFSTRDKEISLQHKNVSPENIEKAANQGNLVLRNQAILSDNATSEQLNRFYTTGTRNDKTHVLENANVPKHILHHALDSGDDFLQSVAAQSRNADEEHLKKAIMSPDYDTASHAIWNKSMTKDILKIGFTHVDRYIVIEAKERLKRFDEDWEPE